MAEEDIYRETPESEPEPPQPPSQEEKGETIFKREEKGISGKEEAPGKEEITPSKAAPPEEEKLPPYFKKKELTRWLRTDPEAFPISRMPREKRVQIPDKLGGLLKKYKSSSGAEYNINQREVKRLRKILGDQERYKKTKDEKGRWRALNSSEVKEARQTRKLFEKFLEDRKSKK